MHHSTLFSLKSTIASLWTLFYMFQLKFTVLTCIGVSQTKIVKEFEHKIF